MTLRKLLAVLYLIQLLQVFSQGEKNYPDVQKYKVQITPDLVNKSIDGTVIIDFLFPFRESRVIFDCGGLKVSSVLGAHVKSFRQEKNQLIVELSSRDSDFNKINITYSGSPKSGMIFKKALVYTVFATDEWMVCNTSPSDKALLNIEVIVPDSMSVIISSSKHEAPAYTYGFAIGSSFNEYIDQSADVSLAYYSNQFSEKQLQIIFEETPLILSFLSEKSGVPYYQDNYSQILAGDHYQEMSGFSMIKSSYGNLILKDSTETNLITHELAHQWWGNQITCQNWNHFWLNEGFATYLSAAFNETRFGKEKYMSDIESYRRVYQKLMDKGSDKPLVFPDWSNPTRDDRNIVYFKGAYVLHLLRQEMGDRAFWKGIKLYSQEHFGGAVTTSDFQEAMETVSKKSLKEFFEKWIY